MEIELGREVYYRFTNMSHSSVDEWGDVIPGSSYPEVYLQRHYVKHRTPCGVRLTCGRFINEKATKRYAWPTIEEAKISFLKRKEREIAIYQSRVRTAEKAMKRLEDRMRRGNFTS